MARDIAIDGNGGYRAVVKYRGVKDKTVKTRIEGIYKNKGTARARVSFWRNYFKNKLDEEILFLKSTGELDNRLVQTSFLDGWVEEAEITWKRVD